MRKRTHVLLIGVSLALWSFTAISQERPPLTSDDPKVATPLPGQPVPCDQLTGADRAQCERPAPPNRNNPDFPATTAQTRAVPCDQLTGADRAQCERRAEPSPNETGIASSPPPQRTDCDQLTGADRAQCESPTAKNRNNPDPEETEQNANSSAVAANDTEATIPAHHRAAPTTSRTSQSDSLAGRAPPAQLQPSAAAAARPNSDTSVLGTTSTGIRR